ncbi:MULTISPECIES: aminotransferase-like domain-containing protein [unclassified Pseudomonas]|uniref:aminotransferase-like domain-containing protein n=1 Tax=unclassified Pseudomonas TaxID=196821 RepID=UPI000484C31E|nr:MULTISPECIES: PLP-dependent aminotransferase family protein [unclassified Pseudomonas]RAS22252.1 DNA-binding transcriptional MocR family regulator [Pseudomonas sp. URMO17WK12:I7]SMF60454.1 transcriptional regulator, GntR family [Pseudomonas sp. URMO17WK12:I5]
MGREFAYQAVYRYLIALIDEAERGGQPRLPSLRALSRRLRVSLATVQAAYSLLEQEGRVQSVPKSGYFAQVSLEVGRADAGHGLPAQPLLERALFAHERRLGRLRARPTRVLGGPRLRDALAERYTRSSRQYWRPEDVHLGPDVQALLETLLQALALQGSTVLVTSPCCWRILRALQRCDMRVLEVPLDGGGSLDIGSLSRLLRYEPVRMMIMPSCLAIPVGRVMPERDQQQIADLLAAHPVWLLENDLDSELCFSVPPCSRLRDWVDPRWLLVLGSLEATVGAEAPYAYLLGRHEALVEAFAQRAFQLAPTRQQALAQMITTGEIDQHLARTRAVLHGRMEQMCQQLRTVLGRQVDFDMPEGGYALWVRLSPTMVSAQAVAATADSALQVLAGEQFGLDGRYRQFLALTWLGEQPKALGEALERLARALAFDAIRR